MDCRIHKLVADVAVVAEGKVLMVRYRDTKPYDGQRGWFLPDDYLQHFEPPEEAAKRIALEQAAVSLDAELAFVESFGNGAWHLVFHHLADLDATPETRAGTNVEELAWFPLTGLPPAEETAHHGWALEVLDRMGMGSG
jgi:ADP-ribose pyrophosphatase YjhB (NUDIX family)